jgi:hypothetical protein
MSALTAKSLIIWELSRCLPNPVNESAVLSYHVMVIKTKMGGTQWPIRRAAHRRRRPHGPRRQRLNRLRLRLHVHNRLLRRHHILRVNGK